MKSKKYLHSCIALSFGLVFLLVLACESEMKDPKGTLEKQAAQYWTERLVNKDYEYTYKQEIEEGLPPFSTYEKQLKAAAKIPTSLVKTQEVEIDGDRGVVTMLITCRLPGMKKDYAMPTRDLWILEGNQWKHHFQVKSKGNIPGG
jgi:hypothetical protein